MGRKKIHSHHFLHVCVLFHPTCATVKGGWQAQVAQLNKLSLWELFQLADGKTAALSVTLCPLDSFTSPNVLLFGRWLQEPAELCECGWALHGAPTGPAASRANEKGHTSKARATREPGGKGKTSAFLKKSWDKERPGTKVET